MKTFVMIILIVFVAGGVYAQIDPDTTNGDYVTFDEETALSFSVQDCGSGAAFEVVENPDSTDMVAQFTTSDCTNESFKCDEEFMPIQLNRPIFKVHVKAPAADKKVGLTLFDMNDAEKSMTVEATTTSAEWEKLEFDFSDAEDGVYNAFAVHPDLDGTTAGEVWYVNDVTVFRDLVYWDDLVILDFDEHPNYMFNWSCNSELSEFAVVENPLKEGINKSDNCCWFYTDDCVWEGCATAERLDYLDFDSFPYLVIDVLAPYEGATFMLKIENYDTNTDSPIEVQGASNTADVWEKLVFDFSGADLEKYQRVAIFPGFPGTEEEEWYFDNLRIADATNVREHRIIKVFDYELNAVNYPNPFNPSTTIEYTLAKAEHVKLTVYDLQGRQVAELVDAKKAAGTHQAVFDAADLSSGVYVYSIQTSTQTFTDKMLLVK